MRSPDGLDVTALRALRRPRKSIASLEQRIEAHLDAHEGYVAFSGGKDSLVVLDMARRVDPEVPVVFFDSGFEYPETYEYLLRLRELWSLNLMVVPARVSTWEVLAKSGQWTHDQDTPSESWNLHEVLIADPSRRAHDMFGPGELWGVRAEESKGRRMAYAVALNRRTCSCCSTHSELRRRHGGQINRKDGTVAFGPVWDWTDTEIWGHIGRHQLPANPVYDRLREIGAPETFWRVSHLVDGARLEDGRLVWLQRGWPALFNEVAAMLPRVREFS